MTHRLGQAWMGIAALVFTLAPATGFPAPLKEKLVMGWLESVYLRPWNVRVTAKLDTGAKTSSLNADQISHFSKDGEKWVRFTLRGSEDHKALLVERPLVRTALIKERKSKASERDVVKMVVCKSGRDYETEFTLVDRSNFNYPLLLGRSFLENVALVDSSATFLFKADDDSCRSGAASPEGSARGQ